MRGNSLHQETRGNSNFVSNSPLSVNDRPSVRVPCRNRQEAAPVSSFDIQVNIRSIVPSLPPTTEFPDSLAASHRRRQNLQGCAHRRATGAGAPTNPTLISNDSIPRESLKPAPPSDPASSTIINLLTRVNMYAKAEAALSRELFLNCPFCHGRPMFITSRQ